jgi:putative aldouronate transport system substrate-binding protein
MKKKALHKSLAMIIAILLTMGLLAACGSNNENNNVSSTASSTASSASSNEGTSTNGAAQEKVTLDIFVDQSWWPVKDWSGPVPEEITKRTGINLNVTVASDEKQLPLMIASGDLPDLVVTSEQYIRMSDPKLSHDWKSLIEQYTPDFDIAQERVAVNTMNDGKFYTIRNNFSTKEEWEANKEYALTTGAAISYRADIAKELGSPKIESLDDLKNMFILAKEKFPDMIPLVLNPTPTWAKGYFSYQFGATIDGFVENEEGKLIHSLRTPNLEKMYLYMNDLYRNGIIKAETFAYKNEDQAKSLVTSGKAFAYAWTTGGAEMLTAATEGTGMEWEHLPVKINEDYEHLRTDVGWQGVFITKNNKNPEASIKLMQYLQSDEGQKLAMWGIEGTDWTMSAEGNYPAFTYNRNDDDVKNQKGVFWWGLLGGSAVSELVGNYVPGTKTTATNQGLSALTTFNSAIGMVTPEADSHEQIIKNNVKNIITNEEVKVYMATSEENAKKAFASMLSTAEKSGLSKLEEWANKRYEIVKPQFK